MVTGFKTLRLAAEKLNSKVHRVRGPLSCGRNAYALNKPYSAFTRTHEELVKYKFTFSES